MFRAAMANLGKLWLIGGIVVMLLALLYAVALTSGLRGKKIFRSIIYLPNLVSAVAMGTMWLHYAFNKESFGLFNSIIKMFGGDLVMWTVSSVGFFIWGQVFDPVNLSYQSVMPLNYVYELVFGSSNAVQAVRNSGTGAAIAVKMAVIVIIVFGFTNFIVKNDDIEL